MGLSELLKSGFTRRQANQIVASIPVGGGGGIPIGTTFCNPSSSPVVEANGISTCQPTGWLFADDSYPGPGIGPELVETNSYLAAVVAGWYVVKAQLNIGFPVAAGPDALSFDFSYSWRNDGSSKRAIVPMITMSPVFGGLNTVKGANFTYCSDPFYEPGLGKGNPTIGLELVWPGVGFTLGRRDNIGGGPRIGLEVTQLTVGPAHV